MPANGINRWSKTCNPVLWTGWRKKPWLTWQLAAAPIGEASRQFTLLVLLWVWIGTHAQYDQLLKRA